MGHESAEVDDLTNVSFDTKFNVLQHPPSQKKINKQKEKKNPRTVFAFSPTLEISNTQPQSQGVVQVLALFTRYVQVQSSKSGLCQTDENVQNFLKCKTQPTNKLPEY